MSDKKEMYRLIEILVDDARDYQNTFNVRINSLKKAVDEHVPQDFSKLKDLIGNIRSNASEAQSYAAYIDDECDKISREIAKMTGKDE